MRFVVVLATLSLIQAKPADISIVKPMHKYVHPRYYGQNTFRQIEEKITGGEEAVPNSFPYQAALYVSRPEGIYFCGGSLISASSVLTAAHCVDGASEIEVLLGAHNVANEEPTQQRLISRNFVKHEKYSQTIKFDIAIIKLPVAVEFNDHIQPVKLPSHSDVSNDFADLKVIQSGWGKTADENTDISDVLYWVSSTTITNKICNRYYLGLITESNICTNTTGGVSTCNGDSGGPLTLEDRRQVGITSFNMKGGCEIGFPAGFTRVTTYLSWIEDNSDVIINQ